MVLRRVRQSAVAVVCPRVLAVLSRPSSPGEATILSQKEGAVAVVCPRVPAILPQPSSPGEATILYEKGPGLAPVRSGLSAATSSAESTPIGALATGEAP